MNNIKMLAIEGLISRLKNKGYEKDFLPVAIYARKSTEDKSEASITSQIESCENLIKDTNLLKTYRIYSDENKSGYFTENRKGFNEMMDDVKKGLVKVIVAYEASRISRNVSDFALIDKILEENSVIVIYVSQTFEKSAMGNLQLNITRALDSYKPEAASEAITRTVLAKANQHLFNGGTTPYGYKILRKKYVVNKEEAKVVKLIFNDFNNGFSIPEIIEDLDIHGYKNRKGKSFSVNTITYMLMNVRYVGTYLYNTEGARKRKNKVGTKHYDEVRCENAFPGIIDKTLFDSVQSLLQAGKPRPAPNVKNSYPLKGYLICGKCGNFFHGEVSYDRKGRKYLRYVCKRKTGCTESVNKESIDRATAEVLACLVNQFANDKQVMLLTKNTLRKSLVSQSKSIKIGITRENNITKDLVLALGRTNDKEIIDTINEELASSKSLVAKLNSRLDAIKNCLKSIDNVLKGVEEDKAIVIDAETILEDEKLFKKLLSTFITSIKYSSSKIIFDFKQLK